MKDAKEVQREAERFAGDMERFLAGQAAADTLDDVEKADLEMARLLYQARSLPSRRFEFRLRNQLLDQFQEKEAKAMPFSRVFRSLVRPLLVATVSAVLLFGLVMVVSPEARAAAGGWAVRFVEADAPPALQALGAKLVPQTAARPDRAVSQKLPAVSQDDVAAGKPIEGLGLPVPAVPQQASQSLISLESAQASLSFKIRVPSKLPDGYKFLGVVPAPAAPDLQALPVLPEASKGGAAPEDLQRRLPANAPKIEAPQMVMLIFGDGNGGKLTLSESKALVPGDLEAQLPVGRGSLQQVTVNGQPAQYIEGSWSPNGWAAAGGGQLHWQDADGIVYDLMSANLGLKEMLMVAESLR